MNSLKSWEFVYSLLLTIEEYELFDEIRWDEDLNFYVICNDVFYWGTADAELIKDPNDLILLRHACIDIENINDDIVDEFGPLLYCARKRKIRPQNAFYNHLIPKEIHYLFDNCGKERKKDILNPKGRKL